MERKTGIRKEIVEKQRGARAAGKFVGRTEGATPWLEEERPVAPQRTVSAPALPNKSGPLLNPELSRSHKPRGAAMSLACRRRLWHTQKGSSSVLGKAKPPSPFLPGLFASAGLTPAFRSVATQTPRSYVGIKPQFGQH